VTLSFQEYVLSRKHAYSRAGDFAEVIRKDSALLKATSLEELERLLQKKGVGRADLELARILWNSYTGKLAGR
jgi:hypothetical protein